MTEIKEQLLSEIKIDLVSTNVFTRWGCTVCGGCTEDVPILAEGEDEHGTIRVCERCLETGNLDDKLEDSATRLEEQAKLRRQLVGRLNVPSYEAWLGANHYADELYFSDEEMYEWEELSSEAKRSWIGKAKARLARTNAD